MERKLAVTQAREKFRELIEQVQYQGDAFVINRHGKPAAAVVPISVYEGWKRQRAELFDAIRTMQAQAGLDPEEAEKIALEAVRAVRSQEK